MRGECHEMGKGAMGACVGLCEGVAVIRHPDARTLAWLRAMDFLNTIDLLGKEVYPSLHCLGEVCACGGGVRCSRSPCRRAAHR